MEDLVFDDDEYKFSLYFNEKGAVKNVCIW